MDFEGLDLNLLVSLDALLTERNVTRASERLHVSQPAMSAAVQKLRNHLSDPLLIRVGRHLEPTPKAKALAGPVKEFLFRVRALVDTGKDFDPATASRTFRVVLSGYCMEVMGLRLGQHIAKTAPGISCQFDELSADTLGRLYDGTADLSVTIGQRANLLAAQYRDDELNERGLFTDSFVVVGAQDNPVLDQCDDNAIFCRQPYVEVRFAGQVLSVVERALRHNNERPRTQLCVPSFWHAISAVSGTDLIAVVPSRLASLHCDHLCVRAVRAPIPLPTIEENMMWHSRNELDPGHIWLRNTVTQIAGQISRLPASANPLTPVGT